jgi:hypothetical protein
MSKQEDISDVANEASDDQKLSSILDQFSFQSISPEAQELEKMTEQAKKEREKDCEDDSNNIKKHTKKSNGFYEEAMLDPSDYIGTVKPDYMREQFNRRFFVVRKYYGKCAIIEPRPVVDSITGVKKLVLEPLSEEQFRKGFRHITFEIKGRAVNIADIWLTWRNRRQIEEVVFNPKLKPGLQNSGQEYNTWVGFNCDAVQRNIDPILSFYRDIICGGDENNFNYLMDMFAYGVQKPWEKWDKAVAMQSDGEGSGKSMAANLYGDLFGPHKLELGDERLLLGDFTGHFDHIAVVVANEAALNDPKSHSRAKSIVDNQTFLIHHKGFTPQPIPNMMKLIMTTNNDHAIMVSKTARRWLCLRVNEDKIGDYSYFTGLKDFYRAGGMEGFLWYLKNRDTSKFNKYQIVVTDMLKDQKEKSLGAAEKAVLYLLDTGYCPKRHYRSTKERTEYTALSDKIRNLVEAEKTTEANTFRKSVLFFAEMKAIKKYLGDNVPEARNISSTKIKESLEKTLFTKKLYDGNTYWYFPDLKTARVKFNEMHKIDHKWDGLEFWIDGNENHEDGEY